MRKMSFNKALDRLEIIVNELEAGPVELEKALQLFEEGVKLSGLCQTELEKANARVSLLVQESGNSLKLRDL